MATPIPGTQTIRFRRPTNQPGGGSTSSPSSVMTRKNRHAGILQDQLRRSQKAPWCPSFSLAFRIFLLIRVMGAMYAGLSDCDEVFNFWEPLHYLHRGHGFQTWETSPEFSIRSWAYILPHLWPGKLANFMFGPEKRPAFFAVRILLAFISATCEAFLYRTVVDKINYRAGRYLLFMMLFNAGMWNASVAFLPSSFAMYFNAIGFTYFIEPTNNSNFRRTLLATLAFATGALVGWPFAIAVALPFVFEELFLFGKDQVSPMNVTSWRIKRWTRLIQCGLVAALLVLPIVAIDTLFYGKLTIVPWNIVNYNVFSSHGPNLYGTEHLSYYIDNLLLNMNVIIPLAFFSLPALLITHRVDFRRLGERAGPERSSPYTLLAMRLLPMYVWFAIFGSQPHKEERFMFPVYPLICFNAAVCLYLVRGWMETAYVAYTKSPYRASQAIIFSRFTLSVVTATSVISISRGIALYKYYHAPMALTNYFEAYEIPRILNETGYVSLPPPLPAGQLPTSDDDNPDVRIDYDLINPFNLTLCYGKEWHRFPGSYLVPDGVRVEWVKSEFDGMLPGHFQKTLREGGLVSRVHGTRVVPKGLNDLNKEEPSFYVDVNTCDYLVDSDFPLHPSSTPLEPRYAVDEAWYRVKCEPFLDARHSSLLTRTLWLPGTQWQSQNEFGDYCLLKNKKNMETKERSLAINV
ncbi:glycosyltransferase family 22 protein [Irpex rosettiformis]|uniref:Glycosyltransferase family 22 protein n=1 Tax=Irpex rosettiformis TaxID=378272 RepID=A0ACB8UKS1_9APHY|nr:glycosyltransferase family 22 protein [Irpex rosettiformis]